MVGLEIAASAAELGIKVTVIEIAPRILARVCDEETSAIIHQRHRDHGVDIRTGTVCAGLQALPDGRLAVVTKTGETHRRRSASWSAPAPCPTTRWRRRPASPCRTASWSTTAAAPPIRRSSRPATARAFPARNGPVRLENWRHAQEHGAVVGRNAAGGDAAYNVAPSYWSEQYDLYIQGIGWPVAQPSARVRRKISDKATLLFELDGARIAYALGINAQRDIAAIRRLIERRDRRSTRPSSPIRQSR